MLTLPPHCSHKLQPLDCSVYGPFKTYYNQACSVFMVNHPGQPISIHNVAEIVGKSYPQAFTPKNIISGFSVTGIWPFNPNNFSEDDYLCSYVTDRPMDVSTPVPLVNATHTDSYILGTSSTTANKSPEKEKLSVQESTSTACLVSPHIIRPFPKAPPRKTKGGRKRG